MRTHKSLYRLVFGFWLRIFSFSLRIFVQTRKGSKVIIRSALPSDVMWAKAHICASPYSCNKIGRGIPARFRRFSNCSSLVFFFRLQPEFPSVEDGSGVCLGLPLKSQHGAFLAVYGGHSLGFSFGDMTLPLSFSKQHSV